VRESRDGVKSRAHHGLKRLYRAGQRSTFTYFLTRVAGEKAGVNQALTGVKDFLFWLEKPVIAFGIRHTGWSRIGRTAGIEN
jgi:hypothetical protein